MNMQVLRRSRKRLWPGDIFVYRLKDLDFGFGRVIRTRTAVTLYTIPAILVYFYRAFTSEKTTVPPFRREELLLPPKIVGPELWRMGNFENIARRRLTRADVLPTHCFYESLFDIYVDERGRRLRRRVEPCGSWALTGYHLVDRLLSEARGIAPDPDTIPDPEALFGGRRRESEAGARAGGRRSVKQEMIIRIKGPGRRGKPEQFVERVHDLADEVEELVQRGRIPIAERVATGPLCWNDVLPIYRLWALEAAFARAGG
jgi:hypothetical protein